MKTLARLLEKNSLAGIQKSLKYKSQENTWVAKSKFQIRENQPRFSTILGKPECGRCRMCFVKLTIIVNRVSRTCTWESECWQMKFRLCTYDDVVPWFEHSSIKNVKIQLLQYCAFCDGKKVLTKRKWKKSKITKEIIHELSWMKKKTNFHIRTLGTERSRRTNIVRQRPSEHDDPCQSIQTLITCRFV